VNNNKHPLYCRRLAEKTAKSLPLRGGLVCFGFGFVVGLVVCA